VVADHGSVGLVGFLGYKVRAGPGLVGPENWLIGDILSPVKFVLI